MPEQFGTLDLIEFEKMLKAYQKAEESRRWEMAYWVSNMMSIHTKKRVQPKELMKPYLPKKSTEEITAERDEFFKNFAKQRKEAESWQQ